MRRLKDENARLGVAAASVAVAPPPSSCTPDIAEGDCAVGDENADTNAAPAAGGRGKASPLIALEGASGEGDETADCKQQ